MRGGGCAVGEEVGSGEERTNLFEHAARLSGTVCTMHGNISGDAEQRDWEEHACTSLMLVASTEYRSLTRPDEAGQTMDGHEQ